MASLSPGSKNKITTGDGAIGSAFFSGLATGAARHPIATSLIYTVLAVLGLVLSLTRLEIDTDPGRMIANDLPFRQNFAELNKTFPQFDNIFVVVIDDENSETGRMAALKIAKTFAEKSDLFTHVFAPGTEQFFQSNGVLYLGEKQIKQIIEKIKQTRPLFLTLSSRPNLGGMEQLYDLILLGAETGNLPDDAVGFLKESTKTADAHTTGSTHNFDWESLQGKPDSDAVEAPTRWYVLAKPILDFSAIEPAEKPLAEARKILSDSSVNPLGPEKARLTGEAAVNAEELNSVTKGAALAGIISFILVTLVVYFGMPYKRLIFPVIAMLVAGILIDVGFATLAIGHLNMISVAFAVLFIGLGIDYAVHFVLRFAESLGEGESTVDAIGQAAARIGPALFLCTLTTSTAFLVFSMTDFAGMAQLGIVSAAGIVIAFIASLTLIPALLTFIKLPEQQSFTNSATSNNAGAERFLPKVRPLLSLLILGLAVASVFAISHARFDGDPINLKDPDEPSVEVFNDLIASDPELIYAAQIVAPSGTETETLVNELQKLKTVSRVNWINSFLPGGQKEKVQELHKLQEIVPPTPELSADIGNQERADSLAKIISHMSKLSELEDAPQPVRSAAKNLASSLSRFKAKFAGDEMQLKSLETAFMANVPGMFNRLHTMSKLEPIGLSDLPQSIRSRFIAKDGRQRLEIVPSGDMRNENEMRRFVDEVSKVSPNVTGAPVEITGAAATVANAMKIAVLAALGLVGILLFIIFRNVRDVALVLLPIGLSASLLMAYTVVFDAPFNFANIIVFPLLLGLGVDSSIHYVMRLRETGYKASITSTSTPKAVLLSALTTIGSFGTLWLSQHLGLSSMGELLTISIIFTLLCTLLVLPQIVEWTIAKHSTE